MQISKFLFPSLLVTAVGALMLRRIVKPAPAKPMSNGAPYDRIDAYIEKEMRRLKIPGLSLAIVEGDKIAYLRGFGMARPGGQAPSSETPFVLGSTTKSFTALAVMQLVEAGKIELDAPVQRYLPWFCVADPVASSKITVRQLLIQTSGLPMLPAMTRLLVDFDNRPDAAERQARALSTLKLTRPVGSEWEYSNLNYMLAGLVIEQASGESYEDYIEKHIFTPLQMRHSYTTQAEAKKNGLAVGHRYWFSFPIAAPKIIIARCSVAAGQLISCAEDMAHYLIAHLNGGRYGDAQILSPTSIAELHRGVAQVRVMGDSIGQYGMGWFVTDVGKSKVINHGGNLPDFSSFMAILPEQKKGVVLLLNADHYGLPMILEEVGLRVAALLDRQQPAPNQLGSVPWLMRALLLIPILQIVGVVGTLLRLRGWRRNPQNAPSRERMWGMHILLPLIPNLSLAALPIFLQAKGILRYLNIYNPDVCWTAVICGGFAGIWGLLRTGLILRTIRSVGHPRSMEDIAS